MFDNFAVSTPDLKKPQNKVFVNFYGRPANSRPPSSCQTSVNNGPTIVADCFTINKPEIQDKDALGKIENLSYIY